MSKIRSLCIVVSLTVLAFIVYKIEDIITWMFIDALWPDAPLIVVDVLGFVLMLLSIGPIFIWLRRRAR